MVLADLAYSKRKVNEVEFVRCFAKSFAIKPDKMLLMACPGVTKWARRLAIAYDLYFIESREIESISKSVLFTLKTT